MTKIVVALGGNALGDTPAEQLVKVEEAAKSLVPLVNRGHQVILCHGNGPQVGMIDLAFVKGSEVDPTVPTMPLAECTALTQGYIGYQLQQAMNKELAEQSIEKQCVTVVTEVLVDPEDPAFQNPTKPIGGFLDREKALRLMVEYPECTFKEDAGRGWREYVASPKPLSIVQLDSITSLVDAGFVVVACGGGGIPVIADGTGTKGISSVIDKDRSAAKLADVIGAEVLVILTAVDQVAINWGKPDQQSLAEVSVDEMRRYMEQGHFAEGSMKPKVEAAIEFVETGEGRQAIIGSLDRAAEALAGTSGTRVI